MSLLPAQDIHESEHLDPLHHIAEVPLSRIGYVLGGRFLKRHMIDCLAQPNAPTMVREPFPENRREPCDETRLRTNVWRENITKNAQQDFLLNNARAPCRCRSLSAAREQHSHLGLENPFKESGVIISRTRRSTVIGVENLLDGRGWLRLVRHHVLQRKD